MAKGRGIDFELRFQTSRWAEDKLLQGINSQEGLIGVRYGLSEVQEQKALELYVKTGEKEPDILVLERSSLSQAQIALIDAINNEDTKRDEIFTSDRGAFILKNALWAIEVEFSPYQASKMGGRHWKTKTLERWAAKPLKTANPPTAPNIWIKDEDLKPLQSWSRRTKIPVLVAHLFDEEAFAIELEQVCRFDDIFASLCEQDRRKIQHTTGIFTKEQRYDRVDAQGAAEIKKVFIVTPAASIKLGDITGVRVEADLRISASKKYVAHPIFREGTLRMTDDFVSLLKSNNKKLQCTSNTSVLEAEGIVS